jgi:hypothetical protein
MWDPSIPIEKTVTTAFSTLLDGGAGEGKAGEGKAGEGKAGEGKADRPPRRRDLIPGKDIFLLEDLLSAGESARIVEAAERPEHGFGRTNYKKTYRYISRRLAVFYYSLCTMYTVMKKTKLITIKKQSCI